MNFKALFKKTGNTLEGGVKPVRRKAYTCPRCGGEYDRESLKKSYYACPRCGGYFRMSARRRIKMFFDEGSFCELGAEIASVDVLNFPGYAEKLSAAREKTGLGEGVVCGTARSGGIKTCVFAMEPDFMMGSMGSGVGEKLAALFEYATENSLPVVGFTVSGGARMQEGIVSLMQMAKVSGAVKRHSDGGNFYLAVLTNPTTGGVTASFAMLGDIIVSEPGALIGFAGPRVIEQTIRGSLPEGFQRAEFLLEHGFLDCVVPRREMTAFIKNMLALHAAGGEPGEGLR